MKATRYWWAIGIGCILLGVASSAFGDKVYLDKATFLDLVRLGCYVEDFESHTQWYSGIDSPPNLFTHEFSGGTDAAYVYQVSAECVATEYWPDSHDGLWFGDGVLSTVSEGSILNIAFYSPVTAVGGDFFLSDSDGNVVPCDVIIHLLDRPSVTLQKPTSGTFMEYLSGIPIIGMTVEGLGQYPTVDNFCVGTARLYPPDSAAAPVPVPMAGWAGLVLMGGLAGVKLSRRGKLGGRCSK